MLNEYLAEPLITDTLAECSDATGLDLKQIVTEGPAEELDRTSNTQPALFATCIGLFRLWQERTPDRLTMAAGHSLGEYTALVAAGALPLAATAALLHRRGQLMQAAVPEGKGAMAAVLGLDDAMVEQCCTQVAEQSGQVVQAANFNAPGQVVISGEAKAVEAAGVRCAEAGARRVVPLAVSVPSHCELMRDAAQELEAHIRQMSWSQPNFPVIQNTCAQAFDDTEEISSHLVEQLFSPVRWSQCVSQLLARGAGQLVECGPGKVLTGLNRRINREAQATSVADILAD